LNILVAHPGGDLLAVVAGGAGHPVVAGLLGLGSAGLAAAVVAMAWSVHARQIRLAEQLARRQFIVTGEAAPSAVNGHEAAAAVLEEAARAAGGGSAPVIIEGPDTVLVGEQARYRVRPSNGRTVASWAVGGGSVAQSPDPSRPDELLLVADQPGELTITARAREGMMETRGTKSITAVPDVTDITPPFPLRLFLHGWGLVVVAVLVVGFAGALAALGTLPSADFITLVAPLAAVLAVVAAVRGTGDGGSRPSTGPRPPRPRL